MPEVGSTPATALPVPTATATAPEQAGTSAWIWVIAGLAVLGGLGFAGWAWKRQQPVIKTGPVAELERPQLPKALPPTPEAPASIAEPLQITLEPLRLSLTLLNAMLTYRLEIANRGTSPLTGLRLGADMISAHSSMSREQQLSGPDSSAAVQAIDRIEPGESRVVEGEFRVPFTQIVPIRQGSAALLLPLARFRLETTGAAPVVRTFVVGQPGTSAALQPFRLDQGPRIYPQLAQRAFA